MNTASWIVFAKVLMIGLVGGLALAPVSEASTLNFFFNNLYYGPYNCPSIQKAHLEKLNQCHIKTEDIHGQGLVLLREFAFQGARQMQKETSQCLKEYTDTFSKNEPALHEYRQKLTALWLSKRKAELILKACDQMEDKLKNYREYASAMKVRAPGRPVELTGLQYLNKTFPSIKTDFYQTCQDRTQTAAMKGLLSTSQDAVPILSSDKPYVILEKNRELVVSAKTGKPITDEEILKLNISSPEPVVTFDAAKIPGFFGDIRKFLQEEVIERNEAAQKNSQSYSREALENLFADGSVMRFMEKTGLHGSKDDKNLQTARMYYCLKSDLEENIASEMVDFGIAAVATKKALPASFLRMVKSFGPVWEQLIVNGVTNAGAAAVTTIPKACLKDARDLDKVMLENKDNVEKVQGQRLNVNALPEGFEFDLFVLEKLPMNTVPSCKDKNVDRISLSKSPPAACLYAWARALTNAAPITLAVPLSAVF